MYFAHLVEDFVLIRILQGFVSLVLLALMMTLGDLESTSCFRSESSQYEDCLFQNDGLRG